MRLKGGEGYHALRRTKKSDVMLKGRESSIKHVKAWLQSPGKVSVLVIPRTVKPLHGAEERHSRRPA